MTLSDTDTDKALKGSIKKWQDIIAGNSIDEGARNCPLCELFLYVREDNECYGCPVAESVDAIGCAETPYVAWVEHQAGEHRSEADFRPDIKFFCRPDCQKCLRLAQAELDFLIDLLPAESRHEYSKTS